jgi:predicted Zn-dependent peptidase
MMKAVRSLIDKIVEESALAQRELQKIDALLKSQKEQLDRINFAYARYLSVKQQKENKQMNQRIVNVLQEDRLGHAEKRVVRFFKRAR